MVTAIQQPVHCLWRVRNPYRRGPLTNRLALMTDGDWRDGGFRQRRPSVETLAWVAASMGRGSRIVGYRRLIGGVCSAVNRLTVERRGMRTFVVLRQYPGGLGLQGSLEKEIANLGVVAGSGLPVPSILATDVAGASTGGAPSLLMTRLQGHVHLNPAEPRSWMTRIAEIAVLLHSLDLPARGRNDLETDARMDAPAAEQFRRLAHVDDAAVRARPEEHDVDRDADRARDIGDLVDARRDRDLRLERREIDRDLAHVPRVPRGTQPRRRFGRADDDAGLRSHLRRHARERDAVALREGARAVELDARVARSVGADLADDAHDRVLHRHAAAGRARERHLDGLGDAQPRASERERDGDVGRAHARAERPDRPVRVRVRVAADDDGPGLAVPLFDHDLVADALAGVVERHDPLIAHPPAEDAVRVGDDRRRRGRGVVDEDAHLRRVPDLLLAEVRKTLHDRVDDRVVHHDARHRRDHEVAGTDVAPRCAREDELRHGRSRGVHGGRSPPVRHYATTHSRRTVSSWSMESGPASAMALIRFVTSRRSSLPNERPSSSARRPTALCPVRRCAMLIVRARPKSAGSRISYEFGFT